MNTRNIDLNLLAAFDVLFTERNVTRAARRLGVTQPALSNSLRRLRDLLGDPLFVRTSRGMAPTPRALAIGPQITAALNSIRATISATAFDPGQSTARFVIATLDYMEVLYLPALIERMQIAGPGVKLQFRRLATLFEAPQVPLESGALDCALGIFPQPMTPQSSLHTQVLGHDDWVCIARRGHPAFRRRLSLKAYAALRQVKISYPDVDTGGIVDRHLATRGLARTCPVTLPHFTSVPFHVAQTDCVATLPRSTALFFAKSLPLRIVELPLPLPQINISLVWHVRVSEDPGHRWLRQMIADSVRTERAWRGRNI